jgi:hypothetical protein
MEHPLKLATPATTVTVLFEPVQESVPAVPELGVPGVIESLTWLEKSEVRGWPRMLRSVTTGWVVQTWPGLAVGTYPVEAPRGCVVKTTCVPTTPPTVNCGEIADTRPGAEALR